MGVAAAEHVERGIAGGFCMLGHGRHELVKRLSTGDWIAYYSPRRSLDPKSAEVRAFTAIGMIESGEPHEREMAPQRTGWYRRVRWLAATPAPVRPLLPNLSFVNDVAHWGMAFRRSLIKASRDDIALIAEAMGIQPDDVLSPTRRSPAHSL